MTGSALEFRNLWVRYGRGRNAMAAVRGLDLVVPPGRVVGLVGESGSGKSSVARAAVGLVEASAGEILLDQVDVVRARGRTAWLRHEIQMVFQDPYSSLDPHLTIGQSIDEALGSAIRRSRHRGAGNGRSSVRERQATVDRLLEQVHLDPARSRALPSTLSGGQRQRVALARALAAEPKVLIADEITSSLDVSVQGSVLNLLSDLQRELELTVLFISHNLAVVRHVCDEVVVLNQGRLVEAGPVLEVLEDPQDPYTKALVAAVPQVGVRLFEDSPTVSDREPASKDPAR